MSRYYESTIIINGALEDDGVAQTLERVYDFLKRNGATLKGTDDWGRKRLLYPIDKKTSGCYYRIGFDAEQDIIILLERFFQLDENVIRSLTLSLTERDLKHRVEMKEKLNAIAAAAEAAAAEAAAAEAGTEVDEVE